MKRNIKEQSTNEPKKISQSQQISRLNLALTRKECIPSGITKTKIIKTNNDGAAIEGVNQEGQKIYLYINPEGFTKIKNTVTNEEDDWSCPAIAPVSTSPVSTAGKSVNVDTNTCREILITYLVGALQYRARVETEPRSNYIQQKNDIIRCHGRGAYDKFTGINQNDLSAQVRQNLQPFGFFKKGNTLSWRNIVSILTGRSKGYVDSIHFIGGLNESKNDEISKVIKESLITLSNHKRKEILQENKIVKNRFKFLIEGRKSFTKKETDKFFNNLINEMVRLSSTGIDKKIINEELVQLLGTVLQSKNGEVMEMFKEKFGNWLSNKVVDVDSEILSKSSVKDAVMAIDNNNITKLMDCDHLSDLLTRISIKNWSDNLMRVNNPSTVSDILRKTLKDTVDNTNFYNDLKNRIKTNICPLLDNIQTKMDNAETEIKNKVLST
jgi:hypothetical protein